MRRLAHRSCPGDVKAFKRWTWGQTKSGNRGLAPLAPIFELLEFMKIGARGARPRFPDFPKMVNDTSDPNFPQFPSCPGDDLSLTWPSWNRIAIAGNCVAYRAERLGHVTLLQAGWYRVRVDDHSL